MKVHYWLFVRRMLVYHFDEMTEVQVILDYVIDLSSYTHCSFLKLICSEMNLGY